MLSPKLLPLNNLRLLLTADIKNYDGKMLKKLSFFCFQPNIIKPEKRQQYNTAPCTNGQSCVVITTNIYRCAKRTCSLISQFKMAINRVLADRLGSQKLKYRLDK